ncbi:host attachment protein [Taklimakanibacter lacteus]|uniref:host attachment protein n=1 Tax=Taklimakanibacter lacteus TaxID=2268456 RepID=UPI0013C4FF95
MRMPKTLYLIADGGRARYIERTGPGRFNTFRKFVSAHMHEKSSALSRDRPGRVRESATTARHAIEARGNPRDKVETGFIRAIAADISADASLADFDMLVFIAPAKLQKVLRDALPPALAGKLAKCIDKDLTKVPDDDLYRHLPVFLAGQATS